MNKKNLSVEDVKKKTSGFFGYIKHLAKDPVETLPDAKARWKEVGIFALSSLGLTIIPAVISGIIMNINDNSDNVISKIFNIPTIIGGVGIFYSLFLIFVLLKISMVLKQRECTNCKKQICYDSNVKYEVIRKWVEKRVSTNNGRTNVDQTERAEVKICCICQNCGTAKEFNKQFRLAQYHNGTLRSSYELDELVRGFFTGTHIQ